MNILPAGRTARLFEVSDLNEMLRLYRALDEAAIPGVIDLVPAARTVLVVFDANLTTAGHIDSSVSALSPMNSDPVKASPVVVPTTYDGPDLPVVCAFMGMTQKEFVTWHSTRAWRVAFSGFAPGFAYLVSDDHTVPVPRLTNPRTTVPAGSVAMAGQFTAIYPRSSPGGWQLIGRTDAITFDLRNEPPSPLMPGRPVSFVETLGRAPDAVQMSKVLE